MENFHFSTPHVQNLFDDPATVLLGDFFDVVQWSLRRTGSAKLGVLLVDMNYSSMEQLLEKANTGTDSEYLYLMDADGEIIYHPKQN